MAPACREFPTPYPGKSKYKHVTSLCSLDKENKKDTKTNQLNADISRRTTGLKSKILNLEENSTKEKHVKEQGKSKHKHVTSLCSLDKENKKDTETNQLKADISRRTIGLKSKILNPEENTTKEKHVQEQGLLMSSLVNSLYGKSKYKHVTSLCSLDKENKKDTETNQLKVDISRRTTGLKSKIFNPEENSIKEKHVKEQGLPMSSSVNSLYGTKRTKSLKKMLSVSFQEAQFQHKTKTSTREGSRPSRSATSLKITGSSQTTKVNQLNTPTYWLGQIRLAESLEMHSIALGFFNLAIEANVQPLQCLRNALKLYIRKHEMLKLGDVTKGVMQKYGILEETSIVESDTQSIGVQNAASKNVNCTVKREASVPVKKSLGTRATNSSNDSLLKTDVYAQKSCQQERETDASVGNKLQLASELIPEDHHTKESEVSKTSETGQKAFSSSVSLKTENLDVKSMNVVDLLKRLQWLPSDDESDHCCNGCGPQSKKDIAQEITEVKKLGIALRNCVDAIEEVQQHNSSTTDESAKETSEGASTKESNNPHKVSDEVEMQHTNATPGLVKKPNDLNRDVDPHEHSQNIEQHDSLGKEAFREEARKGEVSQDDKNDFRSEMVQRDSQGLLINHKCETKYDSAKRVEQSTQCASTLMPLLENTTAHQIEETPKKHSGESSMRGKRNCKTITGSRKYFPRDSCMSSGSSTHKMILRSSRKS